MQPSTVVWATVSGLVLGVSLWTAYRVEGLRRELDRRPPTVVLDVASVVKALQRRDDQTEAMAGLDRVRQIVGSLVEQGYVVFDSQAVIGAPALFRLEGGDVVETRVAP